MRPIGACEAAAYDENVEACGCHGLPGKEGNATATGQGGGQGSQMETGV